MSKPKRRDLEARIAQLRIENADLRAKLDRARAERDRLARTPAASWWDRALDDLVALLPRWW